MIRIDEIARALDAPVLGDPTVEIAGATEPALAGPEDLAVALSPVWAEQLRAGRARAALVWEGCDWQALGLQAAVPVARGRLAMARITARLDPGRDWGQGVHPSALVDPQATIGEGASVGPFSVIGAGAMVGARARIGAHVTIAAGSRIGGGAVLHDGVRIGPRVRIGARAILHPNVVIGADGFSFVTVTPAHVETARESLGTGPVPVLEDPKWYKIHSLGGVEIEEDVEIGTNSTVDAGTLRPTRVGPGTKIDNLVQVGHNVTIGAHCLLSAQAGVAGSARIGDRVVVGGKAGIADNVTVGDDVVLGGASVVLSNVPAGRVMLGYPAMPMAAQVESYKALRRLPRILARLRGENPVSKPGGSD